MTRPLLTAALLLLSALPAPTQQTYEPGVHPVPETIALRERQGWRLTGAGRCGVDDASPWTDWISREHATQLRWTGNDVGPLVLARGAFWRIESMAFLGANELRSQRRCPVGVRVYQKGSFGGAQGVMQNVSLGYFRDAIRTADKISDHGNDNLAIRDAYFARNNNCLTLGAIQSMHLLLDNWHVRNCDCIVNVEAGGKLWLRGLDTEANGTLLRIAGSGREIGPNNGLYHFEGVTVDGGGKSLRLVDQRASDVWLRATIESLHLPAVSQGFTFDGIITGRNAKLTLREVHNWPPSARITLREGARLVVQDTDLPVSTPEQLVTDDSVGTVAIEDCWFRGKRLATRTKQVGGQP